MNDSLEPEKFIVDSNGRPLRLYQVWKGKNKFFYGGKAIFGPDVLSLYLTVCLIIIPMCMFWGFVAPGLINAFPHKHNLVAVIWSGVLTCYSIIFLFKTCARDPGIIPRNRNPPDPTEWDSSSLSMDWGSCHLSNGIPLVRTLIVNGIVVRIKYCQTCMLYRPPRCSHCSICDNCVERFDHHCPWVGQCIGKRNYRYFFMFVSGTALLCLHVLGCCLVYLKKLVDTKKYSISKAIQIYPILGVLVAYTFVACWFVGGLTIFHLYLSATNQTTYENFRYEYDRRRNPYNRGFFGNIKEIFCIEIPESRINFREIMKWDSTIDFVIPLHLGHQTLVTVKASKGNCPTDLRQHTIDVDECQDVSNHVASFGKLERCGTQSNHDHWFDALSWDFTTDKSSFESNCASDFSKKDKSSMDHDTNL